MALTSRQLKDALVSWCMEAWKASGRLVTLEQAVQKMVEVKLDSQEGVDEEEPDMRPVMLGPEEGRYLEVTLDDNPSASGKLLERRQMLDRFIRDHPEILAEIDPLLDADILGFSWVDPRMADQLESMDRDVKVLHPHPVNLLAIPIFRPWDGNRC